MSQGYHRQFFEAKIANKEGLGRLIAARLEV
jgi:hypothetical protein